VSNVAKKFLYKFYHSFIDVFFLSHLNNIFIWDLYSFLDVIVLKRVYK